MQITFASVITLAGALKTWYSLDYIHILFDANYIDGNAIGGIWILQIFYSNDMSF